MTDAPPPDDESEPEATPLLAPADGVPHLSVYPSEIADAAAFLASGTGPFAIDAERASGFRYSNRAYLVQIRRAGAGSVLIDPVNHGGDPVATMAPVAAVLAQDEWIFHGAEQDLPCQGGLNIPPRGAGPAVPGRARHDPVAAVRHRTRGPVGRLRPGEPRRDGSA